MLMILKFSPRSQFHISLLLQFIPPTSWFQSVVPSLTSLCLAHITN